MGRAARGFSFSISTAPSSLRFGRFSRSSQIGFPKSSLVPRLFLSEISRLTHPAANGENVGMSKDIVEETVYVFVPPENSDEPKSRSYSSRRTAKVDELTDPA